MAQSRMAGMAMDLGPDDLADVGEAATLATNKMGMEQGQSASIMNNLANGTQELVNDGDPSVYTSDGNTYIYEGSSDRARYPASGGKGARQRVKLPNIREWADGFYSVPVQHRKRLN